MSSGIIYMAIGIIGFSVSFFIDRENTKKAFWGFLKILITVLPVILFIFVLMGLIQVFLPKETIALIMGNSSGILSILTGELLGSISLIQPGAVFPFAGYLKDSGADWGAIYGFVMAAILIGVSTLPMEIKMLGKKFTVVRNSLTFVFVFLLGLMVRGVIA